jgi:hypothetical protein
LFNFFVVYILIDLDAICRELKRREKQREKDAKKAEKAANAPPTPASAAAAAATSNEDDLNPNVSIICGYSGDRPLQ